MYCIYVNNLLSSNDIFVLCSLPSHVKIPMEPKTHISGGTKMKTKYDPVSSLEKGKIKHFRFFEKLWLKLTGWIDGKRGLPRKVESGWMSPHIDAELRKFDEFSTRMCGHLQIDEEADFARLAGLMDSIERTKGLLADAESSLTVAEAKETASPGERKNGEGKLTDAQVSARRSREKAKRLESHIGRVGSLKSTLTDLLSQLSVLHNTIIEKENSSRMIINRVRDHMYERLDVYWRAALRKHQNRAEMPVTPDITIQNRSEEFFLEPHRAIMERAETILNVKSSTEVA